MNITITGADGMLGSNVVRVLLSRGHQVRALVQVGKRPRTILDLDIQFVEGDILDAESLRKAAEGADAIFHLTAHTGIWPSRSEVVRRVNIEGTKNILSIAREANVRRLIYVGTASTFGFGTRENPGNEETAYKGGIYNVDYIDSKYMAHQLVIQAMLEGLPAIIVNPTFMLGPFDSTPTSGAMVLAISKETLPGYAPGGRNFICVKDAAIGIANALDKGRVGESYIIGNKNMSYKEAFALMADTLGVRRPSYPMPKLAVLTYGFFGQQLASLTGKNPSVSYPMARISCDEHFYTAEKAIRELDLPQSPIEEGILECFNWMKSNGIA